MFKKEMSTICTTAGHVMVYYTFFNMTLYKKEASFNISSAILCTLL